MPVTLAKVKELCTAAELQLVKMSHPRHIGKLTASRLREKIALARKRRDKWRDEAKRQRREARGKQRARGARPATDNRRTVLKATIFEETLARFATRLAELEGVIAAPAKKGAKNSGATSAAKAGKRTQSKKPGTKAAKKSPAKKPGRKKAARKKAPKRGPAKSADTGAATRGGRPGVGPLKRAKGRMKVRSESKPARASMHYAESGTKRVSSHMASRTRRNQAKRDSH